MNKFYFTVVIFLTSIQGFSNGHGLPMKGNAYSPGHVPYEVISTLSHYYKEFDLIHSTRVHKGSHLSFDLVLQVNDVFIEVSVGDHGHYYGETVYDYYPLEDHRCDVYCRYHYLHYDGGHYSHYDPYYGRGYIKVHHEHHKHGHHKHGHGKHHKYEHDEKGGHYQGRHYPDRGPHGRVDVRIHTRF